MVNIMGYVDMFRNLLNPKKVDGYFAKEVAKADWSKVVINVVIGTFVLFVAGLIELVMLSSMVDLIYSISGEYTPAVVSEAFNFVSVFVSAVQNFILFFVFGAVLFAVARVLGGKGDSLPWRLAPLAELQDGRDDRFRRPHGQWRRHRGNGIPRARNAHRTPVF